MLSTEPAPPRPPAALTTRALVVRHVAVFATFAVLAGHGPTLLAGLRERIQLELVDRHEFRSGVVAVRYRPSPGAA